MIEVLVEINGFNSLEKIDRNFTDKLTGDLKSILESDSTISYKRTGSCFLFSFTPGISDLNRLVVSILKVFEYLEANNEELRGFNILVNQTRGIISKIEYEGFVKEIYTLEEDRALYVSRNALELFERNADFVESGDYFRMVSHKNLRISNQGGAVDFVIRTPEHEAFTEAFSPFLNGEKSGLFYFYSIEIPGLAYMGYSLARYIEGKNAEDCFLPWMYFFSEDNCSSGFSPIIRSFNKRFLETVPQYLNEVEKRVWNELRALVSPESSVLYEEDAAILLRLYLSAYGRYFKDKNFPAVVFLDGVGSYRDSVLEIIAEVLEELSPEFDIIPVLFSNQPDIPACFRNFNSVKYRFESGSGEDKEKNEFPVSRYHSFLLESQKGFSLKGMDATRNLLEEFDVYSRRILYLSLFLNGIFDSLKIIDILCDEEAERIKYIRAYEDLVLYGFLYPERMINVFPGLVSELKELKNSPRSSVLERIYIRYGMINDPDPQLALCLSEIFRESGDPDRSMEFKLKAVNSLIDRGNTEIALPLIKSIKKEFKKSRLKGSGLSVYTDVMFLKAALHDSRIPLVNELVQEISAADPGDDARVQIALSTVLSEAYYSMYEYHKSLEPAKKALLTAQQAEISGAESGINTLLGKIMLGMQRIEEAKDYFRISRETADPSNGGEQNAETYYLEAVSYYIYGNISQSIRLLDRTIEISRGNGERRWELLALFAKGRIYFDLGRYQQSSDLFSECLALSRIYNRIQSFDTIYPWIARSLIYGGRRPEGERILAGYQNSAEGLFFYSEFLYFEGKYQKALDAVSKSIEIENDRMHIFLSPDFRLSDSGYEYIEDLVFVVSDGHGVLSHLLKAFRAFLSVLNERSAEGSAELARLTRDEKLSNIDPFNGLYYFFHALSLPEKPGTDSLDRLTLISKALRHVQTIASRIDTPDERRAYLTGNYWNSRLMQAGRKNKLL